MTATADTSVHALLSRLLGEGREIVSMVGVPSSYASSHPLTEVEVVWGDGERAELVVKELGARVLTPDARRAKPLFLYDPLREIEVYRDILARAGLTTAALYATFDDDGRRLLAVERVRGRPLTEVGGLDTWCAVAAWLAAAHRRLCHERTQRLIRWDAELVRRWWERAARMRRDPVVAAVSRRHTELAARLLAAPPGTMHGELFASNVIVAADGRVCPVDWELAGVGPQLLDLAALVAGGWPDRERRSIALAYRAAMVEPPPEEAFLGWLDVCRLQLAGQLLAGSRSWTAPAEHAHDWLSDVHALAPRLGFT